MNIEIRFVKDITVVELAGSIDSSTAANVEKDVLTATENQTKVILDMSKVTYLSSAGLRVLLIVYRQIRARNGDIALVGLREEIKDIMADTGFIRYFIIADTLDEVINTLSKQGKE